MRTQRLIGFGTLLWVFVSSPVVGQNGRPLQTVNRPGTFDQIYEGMLDWQRPLSNPSTSPIPQNEVDAKMRAALRGVGMFRDGVQELYKGLLEEERYYPQIRRGLVGDTLNVRASVEMFANRAGMARELTPQLISDYEVLAQQWRMLANRITQWPSLHDSIYQQVDSLNEVGQKLDTLLKVAPKVESIELSTLLASMAVDFDRLHDDIQLDLSLDPQRQQYLARTQRLQTMVYYLRQAVEYSRPHDELVGRFKQMHTEWLPLKNQLSVVEARYISRSVTRLSQADDRIHELLWLPKTVDPAELRASATSLERHVHQIADQVSLRKLLESPNAMTVFKAARDFYKLSGEFRRSVENNANGDLEPLRWDFRALDVAWSDLKTALASTTDPVVRQQVATVDYTVSEIRESIGERPIYNHAESLELIASIDSLSDLLYSDISVVASSNRYDQNFTSSILRSAQAFHRTAHTLQVKTGQDASDLKIQQGTEQLVSQWQDLRQLLNRMTFGQPTTMRNVQQIDQALVKLQVIYN